MTEPFVFEPIAPIYRQITRTERTLLSSLFALLPLACGNVESAPTSVEDTGANAEALQLDPDFAPDRPGVHAEPADDYTLFEADPVRPVAVLPSTGLVAVTNTNDDSLDLARPAGRGVRACGAVKVGMRPVAVAVVRDTGRFAELWVVNHLSDSISVVRIDPAACTGEVVETLYTGDEPRDIVVANTQAGKRVFVTSAHRGQHHPLAGARRGTDLVTSPENKSDEGLADVLVFDPRHTDAVPRVVNLFTDTPRALAVGDGVVYAAGFRSGNRTTVINADHVTQRGLDRLREVLATDESGQYTARDGELVLAPGVRGRARMQGGMPAVTGSGRCVPDPRPVFGNSNLQQVCVETDSRQRILSAHVEQPGQADPTCQCTSGEGTLQPTTGVIVQFFSRRAECGEDFHTFPDGTRGCWLDATPGGFRSPAVHADRQAPPMAWNEDVKLSLPDKDVFEIDVDDLGVRAFSGVGTVLSNMAVQPGTGRVFVTNTEALNLNRFAGFGGSSSSTLLGHMYESRVTVIDPRRGRVQPVHLNSHIDYERCCARDAEENESSLALPAEGVFSDDGSTFYFAALGSDKIGIVRGGALVPGFDNREARRRHVLRDITLGESRDEPTGPVGLALDSARRRLYVKTHISNELIVIDTDRERVSARLALHDPEPESIRAGRQVLYDTRGTSSHGDTSCGTCHVFGDTDHLSWDLGNPDDVTVRNPGPFVVPPELAALPALARDPFGLSVQEQPLTPDFRTDKGPMTTQTMRGMANHGPQHWRGDRMRNFEDVPGVQPNTGPFDEDNSFSEFAPVIPGLHGNDQAIAPELFQHFTDFSLQLTMPPNPLRALDDSLNESQARGRAHFFGCASVSDAQLVRRECTALDGSEVDIDTETSACTCATNPLVGALRGAPAVQQLAQLLRALLSNAELRAACLEAAGELDGLPPETLAALTSGIDALLAADLELDARGLFSLADAQALSQLARSVIEVVEVAKAAHLPPALLDALAAALPPGAPITGADQLLASLTSALALSNLAQVAALDETQRGTAGFRDLLQGCDPRAPVPECRLRVTDTLQTCNGCHTLDPKGNAEFDVYRPGFFGTSGEYTLENESQVFKVPQLRNVYQKVGMFGMSTMPTRLAESVLGPQRGGFFASDNVYQGPQVRGTGFLHDGAVDTVDRFHSALVFVKTDTNPGGLDAVFPSDDTRAACVGQFREASPGALGPTDPALGAALALCSSESGVPDICFLDAGSEACREALATLSIDAATFSAQILPACFQFGSMLEQGAPTGVCAPSGLRERAELESFVLAFDSNLKPMVGQQATLHGNQPNRALRALLDAASRGHCDLGVQQNGHGYLVTRPDPTNPDRSGLERSNGRRTTLGDLRCDAAPITLTCYPPAPDRAEARRSAFDRR
ncbi:MAG TPA: hypothetical protein VMG12_36030 [Polyangiaceae bacterium]|nr:hypothetical protein [Polyangiaceae bacterium]